MYFGLMNETSRFLNGVTKSPVLFHS